MHIHFATCNRKMALGFLKTAYPSSEVLDTPEDAGPVLDLVEKDIIRIQDPAMHGMSPQIIPGKNWKEEPTERARITAVCAKFHLKHT